MYHLKIVSSFSPFVQPVVSLMLEELNFYRHFYFFEYLGAAHAHVQRPYWKWWKRFQHVVKDNESERDANTVPS